MLKSLEEDYQAGNISEEKYNNLYNRYQNVLNKIGNDEINFKKAFKPKSAPSREQYIYDNDNYDDVENEGEDFISENYNILMPLLIVLLIASFISAIYILLFL
ncbi:hypothetical protein [uncultured Methanobrevibacter sp.]|uniref:hypothetical protein n=1 Tax=uncultured Methanobrevibacter sp. TaxID=253161 RepID=UPI0025DBD68A|nr:hypothetical protein [uncultured Methanobrevibacter sp.]